MAWCRRLSGSIESGDMSGFMDMVIAAFGRCPKCERCAYSFDYAGRGKHGTDDGPYATCAHCRTFWRLPSTHIFDPAEFDLEKARAVTDVITDACERIEPSPLVLRIVAEFEERPGPSAELLAELKAAQARWAAIDEVAA